MIIIIVIKIVAGVADIVATANANVTAATATAVIVGAIAVIIICQLWIGHRHKMSLLL